MGVFAYSHEEDTAAFKLEDNISEEVKQQRVSELMEIQEDISFKLNELKVGQKLKVIIDRRESDFWVGRSEFDSPEVDNEILIPRSNDLTIGSFYNIKINSSESFDLFGEPA